MNGVAADENGTIDIGRGCIINNLVVHTEAKKPYRVGVGQDGVRCTTGKVCDGLLLSFSKC